MFGRFFTDRLLQFLAYVDYKPKIVEAVTSDSQFGAVFRPISQ